MLVLFLVFENNSQPYYVLLESDEELKFGVTSTIAEQIEANAEEKYLPFIVDEFSKFARMPEPDTSVQDLTLLVKDAVTLQEAGQPDVRISAEMPDEAIMADLDSTMISQALTNLIKNAGEAIETRQERDTDIVVIPQIKVGMSHDGVTAWITIQDNGIGLPEDRARLFEPYVTTRDKGTGLGLSIVKRAVEAHGGKIQVFSQPGTKTTFTISVPTAPPPPKENRKKKKKKDRSSTTSTKS